MIATLTTANTLAQADAASYETRQITPVSTSKSTELPLTAVTTLVLWLACAGVGAMGLSIAYTRPQPAKIAPPAIQFNKLNVELTNASLPPPDHSAPPPDLASPPPAAALAQPNLPQPIAVAELSPAVAFAVPVEGPVRIVDAAHAGITRNSGPANAVVGPSAPVQTLVFGRGEGRQPAPNYPQHAKQLGQEGLVSVQFVVDESGRVISAEASQSSPWPLLNEAAVRTVRERWRFASGAIRRFEVAIHFRLKK